MRQLANRTALGAALFALAACSGGSGGGGTGTSPVPTPSPTPTPSATSPAPTPTPSATASQSAANFDVFPCLQQTVTGYGITVAQMLNPDTIKVYPDKPLGYPNGRRPADAVVDITLAMAFVDLSQRPLGILAAVPINPGGNDVPYRTDFPYFGEPQGTGQALTDRSGSNFDFRSDADAAYTRVDRMGLAAIATVLIGSPLKNAYNDASPAEDAQGIYTGDEVEQLRRLTVGLNDDLLARGVPICARRL